MGYRPKNVLFRFPEPKLFQRISLNEVCYEQICEKIGMHEKNDELPICHFFKELHKRSKKIKKDHKGSTKKN
jgi:hypothetical protein